MVKNFHRFGLDAYFGELSTAGLYESLDLTEDETCSSSAYTALSGIRVSYKSMERLYSDREAVLILHNMHALMLRCKEVGRAHCSGDGTGYSLLIKEHYATLVQQVKKRKPGKRGRFVFSFTVPDLDTDVYGIRNRLQEQGGAFQKAVEMVEEIGVEISSMQLDRLFSKQTHAEKLGQKFKGMVLHII